jgi:hypothetical protein
MTLRAGVRPWPFGTATLENALRGVESDAWDPDQRHGSIVVQLAGLDESAESGVGEPAPICKETEDAVHVQEGRSTF